MRETKTQNIGAFQYSVTQLGATASRKVFVRLAKLFGAGATGKDPIAAILAALNDEDIDFLCDQFSKMTNVKLDEKHSPLLASIFEEHFAGNIWDMLQWLGFCLEVNYGSFLGELGITPDKLTLLGSKAESLLNLQKTSTSPPGV